MLEDKKKIYLRALSSSRNTFSINIPHKLAKLLELTHNDIIKIEPDQDEQALIITKVHLEDL